MAFDCQDTVRVAQGMGAEVCVEQSGLELLCGGILASARGADMWSSSYSGTSHGNSGHPVHVHVHVTWTHVHMYMHMYMDAHVHVRVHIRTAVLAPHCHPASAPAAARVEADVLRMRACCAEDDCLLSDGGWGGGPCMECFRGADCAPSHPYLPCQVRTRLTGASPTHAQRQRVARQTLLDEKGPFIGDLVQRNG